MSKPAHRYLLKGNEMLNNAYRKIHTQRFTAASFIPTKNGKLKSPSVRVDKLIM